ncbi:MAG: hypothetical protein L0958_04120 [Candidatus Mariimomonas ferrooxydans]
MGESFGRETGVRSGANLTRSDNAIHKARDSVLSFFYPQSGVITGVENGIVNVKFSTEEKLKKGMRFSVFRKGKPFFHPVTKKPMGNSEGFIGRIEISEGQLETAVANNGSLLCRIVSGNPETGDTVRITSSRIKLAFFQDKKADWSLSEVFYEALKESGRFDILESYTKNYEPDELSEAARGLGAEAVLMFSTPTDAGERFLNVKLFWAKDIKIFLDLKESVGVNLGRELTSEEAIISIGSAEGKPWGSHKLAGGKFISMGDLDGNGERELVVSDGNNIRIFDYKQEPREIWFMKGNPQVKILNIDVLDFNNNGRAEIFVTSILLDDAFDAETIDSEVLRKGNEIRMSSFVLEYDPPIGYRRIWDKAAYVLRVVGKKLLMQSFNPYKTLIGPVHSGVWRDGRYQTGKPLELPSGINIYGFIYVDWKDSGYTHILAFDNSGYLSLYNGGELIWMSKESYGEFETLFDRVSDSAVKQEKKWVVKGRLVTVRTGRGQEVIVVKKIPIVERVPGLGYGKAEVYSFWWDGEKMVKTLVITEVHGTVTDYWVEEKNLLLIARPNALIFLKRSLSGDFVKGSILYYYNLAGK